MGLHFDGSSINPLNPSRLVEISNVSLVARSAAGLRGMRKNHGVDYVPFCSVAPGPKNRIFLGQFSVHRLESSRSIRCLELARNSVTWETGDTCFRSDVFR